MGDTGKSEVSYGTRGGSSPMRVASEIDAHVGNRVKFRRKIKKLSQTALGDALGVTFQQIQKYERGTNRISAGRLWDISRVLEVPVSFFYDGIESLMAGEASEVRENDQVPVVYDFMKSSEGLALAIAMSQIENRTLRRQVVELARTLASHERGML